jgi:hypothetical protein
MLRTLATWTLTARMLVALKRRTVELRTALLRMLDA